MAYGARLESALSESSRGFESPILREARARRQVMPTRWPKPRQVKLDPRGFCHLSESRCVAEFRLPVAGTSVPTFPKPNGGMFT